MSTRKKSTGTNFNSVALSAQALKQIRLAKSHGIKIPFRAYRAAKRAGIPFYVACAFLVQESNGGENVFGHDPGNFSGAGTVTRAKYFRYKQLRAEGHGMQGVGPCQLCVDPDSLILTSDLRWEKASKVTEGMEIIAFDEEGTPDKRHTTKRRYFRTARVDGMFVSDMQRVRIVTDKGSVIVTPEHKFLTHRPERYTWKEAQYLQVGDLIPDVPTWTEDDIYEAGYVAGQFDGEGCLTVGEGANGQAYGRLLWSQKESSPDVQYMEALIEDFGFEVRRHNAPGRGWNGERGNGPVAHLVIGGSWLETLRFLGTFRPRRMLRHPRLREVWENRQLNGCGRQTVLAIEPLDDGPMVAHKTSTSTLIVNGLLSHNTWWEFQDEADAAGGCWRPYVNMLVAFRHLATLRRSMGTWKDAARRYNGSGPAADRYADQMEQRFNHWVRVVGSK